MMNTLHYSILSAALALSLPACVIVDDDDPGTLTVEWTIEGYLEPADCAFYGIDRLELSVYDVFDDLVVTQYALCEDFGLSMRLPEGSYSADARLLDGADRSATTTQLIDDIDVFADEELVISIDFPARSFR